MPCTKELPRLTNYLRAYGDVAAPWTGDNGYDPDAISKKRKEKSEKQSRSCDFNTAKKYFIQNSSCSSSEINDTITELMDLAKEIAGTDATTLVIQGAVVYLIDLFRNSTIISNQHTLELRRTFGIYPASAVSKVFTLVKKLIENLNYDAQEDFIENGFPKHNEELMSIAFGSKIKFVDQVPLDDSYYLVPLKEVVDAKDDAFKGLSFKFEALPKEEVKMEPEVTIPKPLKTRKKYDQEWLEESLRNSLDSNTTFSSAEMTLSVMQLLKSRSNEELQNELFDLLGFERIELIQSILEHQDDILYQKVIESSSKEVVPEKRPVCMSQVVIQSETEKLLSKHIRKDERRIQREQSRTAEEVKAPNLDPQRLKHLREEALTIAQNTPIFHHAAPVQIVPASHIYPNVYDMYTETKMSASFISGKKTLFT